MKFLSLTVVEISLTKNWKERKRNKQKEEQIGECPFSIPRYNLSLWTCILNMKFLSLTVVEISLTKNLERKKKEQTKGRTTRTVRKSDYTPALALPKHMAGILDKKCREKEKYREQHIGECPFSIPCYYPLL